MFGRDLGWPPGLNRWNYPEVFLWDADDDGNHNIPALIAFFPNTTSLFNRSSYQRFIQHFDQLLPGRWEFSWQIPDGYIWAERQTEGVQLTLPRHMLDHFGFWNEDEE